jgi:hypothetical protein
MDHVTKNVIEWNRNSVRRATLRLQRARTEAERRTVTNDIRRFEDNIEALQGVEQ